MYTITTGAAMTPVDMSKIIFNSLITILFIADTGTMAPICVRILGCTPLENLNASVSLLSSFLIYVSLKRLIIDGPSIVMSSPC